MLIFSISTMILTVVHHLYGAVIYAEPFRLHVAIVAVPVIIVLAGSYAGYKKTRSIAFRKIVLGTLLSFSMVFSVFAIGLYEGGYNHVIKNILYFSGTPIELMDRIYPSVYELPNDFFFEFTGIAQFITGLMCGLHILRLPLKRWPELATDPTLNKIH
jgi:hypothetical protein